MDLSLKIDEAEDKEKDKRRGNDEFFHYVVDLMLLIVQTHLLKYFSLRFHSLADPEIPSYQNRNSG